MNILHGIILGFLQGLTEFLPVSSSGHLVLGDALLGGDTVTKSLFFKVWVHAATLLAVLLYYRRDLWRLAIDSLRGTVRGDEGPAAAVASPSRVAAGATEGRALLLCLAVGTLPAMVAGLTLEHWIDRTLSTVRIASCMLLVTGVVLVLSRREPARRLPLTWNLALLIGVAQALALPPGISRSGMTITAALLLGIERSEAVRFSFLLSIPTIGGALVLMLARDGAMANLPVLGLGLSAAAAFGSGIFAIWAVARIARVGMLYRFAPYCFVVGALGIAASLIYG